MTGEACEMRSGPRGRDPEVEESPFSVGARVLLGELGAAP